MEMAWRDRPASRSRTRAVVGAVIIVLTGAVIFWASDNNWLFGVVALVLMLFASARFYFTTSYAADEKGIGEKFLGTSRTRKWEEFRRVDVGRGAVLLSPFEEPRKMDRFRGLFVPTPAEEIRDFIVERVKESGGRVREISASEFEGD